MTTIYLVRHAEAEGNLYRRIHGWYDALITENGYRQIAALEERFRDTPVDAVYSSDLFRTRTTARAVCVPKNLPLHTEAQLREVNMGAWEDRPWGEVYRTEPDRIALFNRSDPAWRAPGGENLAELGERVSGAIRRIAQKHPGQTVALFSHGTAIRLGLAALKGAGPEEWNALSHSDNTAVSCLEYEDGAFRVVFEADASHLTPEISTLAQQSWWRGEGKKDVNLWYRPLDLERESVCYIDARREAWRTVHGGGPAFDGEGFLQAAREHAGRTPWGVTCAMHGDEFAGLLQLDPERYARDKAGYIPFCYMSPGLRGQGLGVQLIGQAVSFYRGLGRDRLRLRCAPYNGVAQRFYARYGFVKIGEEQGSRVPLDILEKYIGYER